MDDYSAMIAYTQNIKENAGVQDSFTEEKTESDKQEEIEAKKVVETFEQNHQEKEKVEKTVIEESIDESKPIALQQIKNDTVAQQIQSENSKIINNVNMSDGSDVIHAAIASIENENLDN